jgi:hypothetical protein
MKADRQRASGRMRDSKKKAARPTNATSSAAALTEEAPPKGLTPPPGAAPDCWGAVGAPGVHGPSPGPMGSARAPAD